MPIWTILCCHNDRDRDLFCGDYDDQTAKARANFRVTINVLRDQPTIEGWCRPNGFDLLSGKKYRRYRGLGKLLFKTPEAQHRPLGFFGPRPGCFTLLVWATERDGEFDPPNVLKTALDRMNRIKENPGLARDCDYK
jgi:hypothetical protein